MNESTTSLLQGIIKGMYQAMERDLEETHRTSVVPANRVAHVGDRYIIFPEFLAGQNPEEIIGKVRAWMDIIELTYQRMEATDGTDTGDEPD